MIFKNRVMIFKNRVMILHYNQKCAMIFKIMWLWFWFESFIS